jgi:hypothetical protein
VKDETKLRLRIELMYYDKKYRHVMINSFSVWGSLGGIMNIVGYLLNIFLVK